jgi:hypothetical protein
MNTTSNKDSVMSDYMKTVSVHAVDVVAEHSTAPLQPQEQLLQHDSHKERVLHTRMQHSESCSKCRCYRASNAPEHHATRTFKFLHSVLYKQYGVVML